MAGKEFIDSEGNVVVGTFSMDEELVTQRMLIAQIQNNLEGKAFGGDNAISRVIKPKDVNFYDYDGTLLHSYSIAQAQILTELPTLPSHEGLICQGWNYDLETIKAHNRAINVGATYITDDGKTRLYIRIAAEDRMAVPLSFSQTISNGVTIDWGDGSTTQTLSGDGHKEVIHSYASIGDYVITLDVASGCILGLSDNNSSYDGVMGPRDNVGCVYRNLLQKVEIGNGITCIHNYAFCECYSLTSITIPNNITSIETYAFQKCYSLTSVTIPDSVTSIGYNAFYSCYSLTSIIIPNSVTSIAISMVSNCTSLANVTISDSVTSIGRSAFSGNVSLAIITIPSNVMSIGSMAFSDCHSLTRITIPNGVASIGELTFADCYGVTTYDFTSHTSIPTLSATNAFREIPSDCIIKVPAALYDEWRTATNWLTYAKYIVAV